MTRPAHRPHAPATEAPDATPLPEAATRPAGVYKLTDVPGLKGAAEVEPLLRMADLARVLNCSRRVVERMRAASRLPKPDLFVGNRSPRWKPTTIRLWIEEGGR
jgi:predicted DNA-binding transcriptional regulator AlpA